MADSDEDLEALFEQMSSQGPTNAAGADPSPPTVVASQESGSAKDKEYNFHGEGSNSGMPMFDRLGNVVRMLHDSMRELGYDKSLTEVVEQVNDAKGRLEYVATLTEQAANKVLNATDEGMPAQDELAKSAKQIETRWEDLFAGKLSVDEFKALASDSKSFAASVQAATDAEKARLLEIMMAQDFQDLTGQLIKKVVALNKAVERELAQILIDNAPTELKEKAVVLMDGPSVPSTALEQDDVDNLLDSLGF